MSPTFDLAEGRRRVGRVQAELAAAGLGGMLLQQTMDRYYITGTAQAGFVMVGAQGDPLVLVRRDPDRAALESPFAVTPLTSARHLAEQVQERFGEVPQPLGLELDVLPVTQAERLKAGFPGVRFGDATPALMGARAVKGEGEIALIRRAAAGVTATVARVPEWLSVGVREIDLAADVERELRRQGHLGIVRMRGFGQEIFYGHVMAGATAAAVSGGNAPTGGTGLSPSFPQGAGERAIGAGEPVVVDLVGAWGGYYSDQTRMFSIGQPHAEHLAMYQAALQVHGAVLDAVHPGVSGAELYRIALEAAAATPFGDYFLGERHKVGFVGHGVGLELDEEPFLAPGYRKPLEAGMVFALEPKFIREGVVVVGVEDTLLVTANGYERLTESPQEWGVVAAS